MLKVLEILKGAGTEGAKVAERKWFDARFPSGRAACSDLYVDFAEETEDIEYDFDPAIAYPVYFAESREGGAAYMRIELAKGSFAKVVALVDPDLEVEDLDEVLDDLDSLDSECNFAFLDEESMEKLSDYIEEDFEGDRSEFVESLAENADEGSHGIVTIAKVEVPVVYSPDALAIPLLVLDKEGEPLSLVVWFAAELE